MRTKRLNEKESRKLIWITWFEFLVVGVIVYFFTNPISIALFLAGPVALHALIIFWVKSEGIPVRLHSVVPTVFMSTAFVTGIAALIMALIDERIMNSWTIALASVCAMCIMAAYPESSYADYEGIIYL